MTDFKQKVLAVVASIPAGSTLSYQEVGKRAGSPRAFRAVGSVMKQNFDPQIPCHRVICSDGSLGQYNRGVAQKRARLVAEGVILAK
ncbi:MAG: MGMT family protein [Patescibacteria group bacterium]